MTHLYPIVFETEASGAISAYVPGLPVYAAADTMATAERAIQDLLAAYLEAHPEQTAHGVTIRVAKYDHTVRRRDVQIVSVAALVAASTSKRKAAAARANGRFGGRPRKKKQLVAAD